MQSLAYSAISTLLITLVIQEVAGAQQTTQPLPQDPSSFTTQPVGQENNVTDEAIPVSANLDALLSRSNNFVAAPSYLLGAGDLIYMEIFNLEDYSREYSVSTDGSLTLPLIGTINAQGMTMEALVNIATQQYARYIRRPVITFELREARPLQIAVAGEIKRPGTYTVAMAEQNGGTGMSPPTVTQVLQMAGGITQFADIRNIEIHRLNPSTQTKGRLASISLWDLLQTGDLSADRVLRDGDSIFIPTATAINPAEVAELASASFSPEVMNVYVVGEVDDPGLVEVPPNTPLNQALLAAGSFSERAQTGSVELVRLNPDGTVSQRHISINLSSGISEHDNPLLQPNDTIVVSRSGLSTFSDVVGNFIPPLNLLVNVFRAFNNNNN